MYWHSYSLVYPQCVKIGCCSIINGLNYRVLQFLIMIICIKHKNSLQLESSWISYQQCINIAFYHEMKHWCSEIEDDFKKIVYWSYSATAQVILIQCNAISVSHSHYSWKHVYKIRYVCFLWKLNLISTTNS